METCKNCLGIGEVIVQRKTLAGVRTLEKQCPVCYGTGSKLPREVYEGLIIVKVHGVFTVEELASDFVTLKSAKAAIDEVKRDMEIHNGEQEYDEDKFSTVKEYCEIYLQEMEAMSDHGF